MKSQFKVFSLKDSNRLVVENPRFEGNVMQKETVLVLSATGDDFVSVQDRKVALPTSEETKIVSTTEIFAILGVIELCYSKYLLVVSERTLAATIQQHKIWRVASAKAIPIGAALTLESAKQILSDIEFAKFTLDQELLGDINNIINSGHLYYSSTYDLAHSIQHNFLNSNGKAKNTVRDDRYFFNKFVQTALINKASNNPATDSSAWITKFICGFAGSIDVTLSGDATNLAGKTYTVTLVSRLNHRRLGTRYVRRGLDNDGNAANNVEMEQIVFNHDFAVDRRISSYVQIRGSAPAIWGQQLNFDYRPEMVLIDIDKPESWASISKHYTDLRAQYIGEPAVGPQAAQDSGKVVCVNLLDDKGFEGKLTSAYKRTVAKFHDEKVNYEEFPINKWCKKMNFRNMDILMNRVRDRLFNSQFFTGEGDVPALSNPAKTVSVQVGTAMKISHFQTGLARVSCLDSLDRTNLTCSLFARYMIAFQVQSLQEDVSTAPLFKPVDSLTSASDVHDPVHIIRSAIDPNIRALTNLWADSGDAVSLLYAGTRALKADVTRTGKRQWLRGSLDDGLNSLTRYYLNNFSDGRRQDGYDLWSGKVSIEEMSKVAESDDDVKKKAKQLAKPILQRGKGLTGWLLPGFVIDRVEPLLQAATEFATTAIQDGKRRAGLIQDAPAATSDAATSSSSNGVAVAAAANAMMPTSNPSYVGFLVSAIKIYAPEKVTNVIEFLIAMVVFFYILVIVKFFQLKGQLYVDRPKLSKEHKLIMEMLD